MRLHLFVLVGGSILLASCGQANEAAYDASFTQSCVASATAGGVSQADATALCDCSLAKVNERFTPAEKLTLSDAQAQPIVSECMAELANN